MRTVGTLAAFLFAWDLGANAAEVHTFALPAKLTPETMEEINQQINSLGRNPDWDSILAELAGLPESPVSIYTRSYANLVRRAVWLGQEAENSLRSLLRQAEAEQTPASRRLAAALLLAIGRGQTHLSHNTSAILTLERAVEAARRIGNDSCLVRALHALSEAILRSRHPSEALPSINEMLVTASRAGLRDYAKSASRLLAEWHRQTAQTDDHFGRAQRRLQQFPSTLGLPNMGRFIAIQEGVILLTGEADGQATQTEPVVYRFDGRFVRRLDLPDKSLELRGATVDQRQRLWLGTNRGLYRYDGQRFINLLDTKENEVPKTQRPDLPDVEVVHVPLPSNRINSVSEGPDGWLYIATANGLVRLDPRENQIESIGKDANLPAELEHVRAFADGSVLATWREGYAVIAQDSRTQRFPFEFEKVQGRRTGTLFGVTVERDSLVWVHGHGGAKQLQGTEIVRTVDEQFSPQTRNVNDVLKTEDGAYWFATPEGICRQEGSTCTALDNKRWLPAQWALGMAEWPPNNLWANIFPFGIVRIAPPNQRLFGKPEGFEQPINSTFFEIDGALFFVNGVGLTRLDLGSGDVDNFFSGAEGLPSPLGVRIEVTRMSTGELAIAADGIRDGNGVAIFDGRQGDVIDLSADIPEVRIDQLCESEHGVLLLATRAGFFRLDTLLRKTSKAAEFGALDGQRIERLRCSPGKPVFALTTDRRLFQTKEGKLLEIEPKLLGIEGNPLNLLADERAGLFVIGQRAIARLEGEAFRPLPIDDPEQFDFGVRAVATDERGWLYFTTDSGVLVWNGEDWTKLTSQDGLISDAAFDILYYNNSLWVSGHGGVASWWWPKEELPETVLVSRGHAHYTDPGGVSRRLVASNGVEKDGWVVLRSLAGNFELQANDAPRFWPPGEHDLTPGQAAPVCDPLPFRERAIHFQVTAFSPYRADRPSEFSYHYRLDGGTFRKATGQEITFSELLKGEHVLEVRATNPMLDTDPTPVRYCFLVDPPLSLWSLAGASLAFGLLLILSRRRLAWAYYRFRHRRFRPIEPSPFTPDRPAEGAAFFDRREQIATISSLVQNGGVAVLWGDRGAGKHSLIRKLSAEFRSPNVLVVELDLATITAGGDLSTLIGSMCDGLLEMLQEHREKLYEAEFAEISLTSRLLSVNTEELSFSETGDSNNKLESHPRPSMSGADSSERNPFSVLNRLLRRLERYLPGVRVLYLFDNAELLGLTLESDAVYGSYLFPFLKSLAHQRANIAIVFSLEGRWFELARRFETLLAFASPVAIGPLDSAAASEVLQSGLREKALLPERLLGQLVELSGGTPYLLQIIGDRLVTMMNARKTNVVSQKIVAGLADTLIQSCHRHLERTWLDLRREEKVLAVALSEEGKSEKASAEEVARRLGQKGGGLLAEEVRRASLSLERDGLLQNDAGLLRMRSRLFREWIQRHHTIKSVLDESQDYISHYQLLQCLGEGGMGVVHKARDMVTGQIVAIKLLRSQLSESKRSRRRFLREARLGKHLKHPNIVQILDYGQQGGRLYLAMEFLEGHTLSAWLRRNLRPSLYEVIEVGISLCAALEAVHAVGILHRDIKSDNIIILPSGSNGDTRPISVKLMDFGLAVGKEVSRITRVGTLIGTLNYMSPEQARGEECDIRSDLYSLGVVFYEMLTGSPPFDGPETVVLNAVLNEEPPPVLERNATLPPDLAALVDQLLSKEPFGRPRSAQDVRMRLEGINARLCERQAQGEISSVVAAPCEGPLPAPSSGGRSGSVPDLNLRSRTIEVLRTSSFLMTSSHVLQEQTASHDELSREEAWPVIYEVSAAVAKGQVNAELLHTCLRSAAESLEAERGIVILREEGQLRVIAKHGREEQGLRHLPMLSSLLWRAVEGSMGFVFTAGPGQIEDAVGSAVCAPLWAGKEVFGAMLLDRPLEAMAFLDRDLEVLACIGYLLGLGLERERLLQQVFDQERMALAGQMLAGVAHDLRTPMAVISGYSQLIAENPDIDVREEYSKIINQQVEEMVSMIKNLLTFVRGDTELQVGRVALEALADHLRTAFSRQVEERKIKLEISAVGETVIIDQNRANRILSNLVKNALEVLEPGGQIDVRLIEVDDGLQAFVSDTGPGIPDEIRPKLFQPFATHGKRGGTGLGLAIVKRFAEDHQGEVSVESEVNRGTTFKVTLPCAGLRPSEAENG